MDISTLREQLFNTIQFDIRHKHYARAIELAAFYRMIATGEGQEEYVRQYKQRETDEQKKNRIKATITLTKYAFVQILKVFKRLRRVDNATYQVEHEKEDVQQMLWNKLNNWQGDGKDVLEYWFDQLEYYSFIDPNAFAIIDREDTRNIDGEITDIHPTSIIFSSEQVLNYERKNGLYKWLVVCRKAKEIQIVDSTLVEREMNHYYLFAKGMVLKMLQFDKVQPEEGEVITLTSKGIFFSQPNVPSQSYGEGVKRKFIYREILTGGQEIPFFQLGAYLDFCTKGELFVSPLEDAREIFLDLINLKSQFDLTKFLHTFPQKIAYSDSCTYEHKEYGACDCGTLARPDNRGEYRQCPSCKGTGRAVHLGTQDIIYVKFPNSKEDFIPLRDMIAYIDQPEWLPKWQNELLELLLKKVSIALFQQEIFETPHFQETATKQLIEVEKIYDTLAPYASLYSFAVKKSIRLAAQYLEVYEGLKTATHVFQRDFKLRSLEELIVLFKSAKDSGVSYQVLWSIQCDILSKIFENNSLAVERAKVQQSFLPFEDKSSEETAVILSYRADNDPDKLLWENADRIFTELFKRYEDFHLWQDREQQRQTILEIVQEVAGTIEYSNTSNNIQLERISMLDEE